MPGGPGSTSARRCSAPCWRSCWCTSTRWSRSIASSTSCGARRRPTPRRRRCRPTSRTCAASSSPTGRRARRRPCSSPKRPATCCTSRPTQLDAVRFEDLAIAGRRALEAGDGPGALTPARSRPRDVARRRVRRVRLWVLRRSGDLAPSRAARRGGGGPSRGQAARRRRVGSTRGARSARHDVSAARAVARPADARPVSAPDARPRRCVRSTTPAACSPTSSGSSPDASCRRSTARCWRRIRPSNTPSRPRVRSLPERAEVRTSGGGHAPTELRRPRRRARPPRGCRRRTRWRAAPASSSSKASPASARRAWSTSWRRASATPGSAPAGVAATTTKARPALWPWVQILRGLDAGGQAAARAAPLRAGHVGARAGRDGRRRTRAGSGAIPPVRRHPGGDRALRALASAADDRPRRPALGRPVLAASPALPRRRTARQSRSSSSPRSATPRTSPRATSATPSPTSCASPTSSGCC